MKLNVVSLRHATGKQFSFAFEVPAAEEFFWLRGPVSVSGKVANSGGHMVVSGTIRALASFECQCCLRDYETELVEEFRQEYRETSQESPLPKDAEYSVYEGDELDLTELVRDTLLLAEPMKKVCRLDCKGLCPVCGQDRNQSECHCDHEVIDPRLAALKQLLDSKQ